MENLVVETTYPLFFRQEDSNQLGKYLQGHHSVVLIGMKRVGINNFLRFFLYHKDIIKTFISKTDNYIFIPIDLNDLVERELFPFWILTLKRIVDTVQKSPLFDKKTKKEIERYFLDCIQSKELFLTIDCIRKTLLLIIQNGVFPTIFFLRFDRIKDAVTPEFFDNLQGLKDATHQKVSFVFTSFRGLDDLAPQVFTRSALSIFSHNMYIKPVKQEDMDVVSKFYQAQNQQQVSQEIEKELLNVVGGSVQYLQLAFIFLRERHFLSAVAEELSKALAADEQVIFQSEEIWESLRAEEQNVLKKISQGLEVTIDEKKEARYLWDTGIVFESGGSTAIFSPLLLLYVKNKMIGKIDGNGKEFTRKEHLLFTFLKEHENEICEREKIVAFVWPETENFGVSDWAIDRLVARVRGKLKKQGSLYEIQTVKTRGYKLVANC